MVANMLPPAVKIADIFNLDEITPHVIKVLQSRAGDPARDPKHRFQCVFPRCSSNIFIADLFEMNVLRSSWNDSGNLQNVFKYSFGPKATLKSQMLDLKTDFWTSTPPATFSFSSITFFHPKFSNRSCRKGSYGPFGPFCFSVIK